MSNMIDNEPTTLDLIGKRRELQAEAILEADSVAPGMWRTRDPDASRYHFMQRIMEANRKIGRQREEAKARNFFSPSYNWDHDMASYVAGMDESVRRTADHMNRIIAPALIWAAQNVQGPTYSQPKPAEPESAAVGITCAADPEEAAFMADYVRRARKVGYHCPEAENKAVHAELEAWLHEQGMSSYEEAAVKRYMDAVVAGMMAKDGGYNSARDEVTTHHWTWVPLRECDFDQASQRKGAPKLYTRPIPSPVLDTVTAIAEKFGDTVRLEVSDIYTAKRPDPFLAVSARGAHHRFIPERWDEPKFRG